MNPDAGALEGADRGPRCVPIFLIFGHLLFTDAPRGLHGNQKPLTDSAWKKSNSRCALGSFYVGFFG